MAMRRILRYCSAVFLVSLCAGAVISCQQRGEANLLQTTFKGLRAEKHCVPWQGVKRCYYLVQPNTGEAKALLLALHPAFHDVAALDDLAGIVRPVAAQPIAAIYPEGIDKQWNDGRHAEKSKTFRDDTDDVGFLRLIVSDTQNRLGLSAEQTTIAGMSNGGMMSLRMACETYVAKKILAVVANLPVGLEARCVPELGRAVLVFGTEDDVVPYAGGNLSGSATDWGAVLSAEKTEVLLASHMGCQQGFSAYRKDSADDNTVMHKRDYRCGKNSLESYHIEGMGHTWPDEENVVQAFLTTRGRISRELNANQLLIDTTLAP